MRFTTREDYGIVFMTHLAINADRGPLSLRDIAEREHISFLYLEKIAQALKEAGLIKSTRGAHGGYQLSREPKAISVGDIIQTFTETELVRCLSHGETCPREDICVTKHVWQRLQSNLSDAMRTMTLADVVADTAVTSSVV